MMHVRPGGDDDHPSVVELAGRKIGSGSPCFIIAEAGVNHNGNLQMAHNLVDAAAGAGADAVKFQTWITERLCKPGAKKAAYQQVQCPEEPDQFTMIKRLELSFDAHRELKEHAQKMGIVYLSSAGEMTSARFLCEMGVPAMKVGSGDLSNLPYLRQVAALGKPIILSTGMGSTDDVRLALTAIQSTMSVPVVLLHCVSAYPAPESEMNLRCIVTLREEFGLPVGLSDHTKGSLAATVAVGLGMVMLEKHLTLDHTLKGPDHAASAEPAEFAELVRLVRRTQAMLGTGVKMPAACEVGTYAAVQRVLHYLADLPAGHVLRLEDMEALRCGLEGLSPEAATRLEGRMLRHAVRAGLLVKDEDAE